jgi:site-specific recombinase XerD
MSSSKNSISCDPFRSLDQIAYIKNMLRSKPRELLLFVLGINSGLRVCDIVRLKVKQFKNAQLGDIVAIIESKTGKPNYVLVNSAILEALQNYFAKTEINDNDYLFWSQKGKFLKTQRVRHMIQDWAAAAGAAGHYGAHSLRKTFGYIQRTVYGATAEVICKRFNHSSPSATMVYLNIEDDEVKSILSNEI